MKLTPEESKAIASLKRVAKKWPKSLWLFSASGSLTVMKKNKDGKRVYTETHGGAVGGGVDQSYAMDTIAIENDGGDY